MVGVGLPASTLSTTTRSRSLNPVSPRLSRTLPAPTSTTRSTTTPKPMAQAVLKCPSICSSRADTDQITSIPPYPSPTRYVFFSCHLNPTHLTLSCWQFESIIYHSDILSNILNPEGRPGMGILVDPLVVLDRKQNILNRAKFPEPY
jgi:hypothetical protein